MRRASPTAMLAAPLLALACGTAHAGPRDDFAREADALVAAVGGASWPGNVAVVYGGTPMLRKAYGLAERAWEQPTTLDTAYRVGTLTKMMTAVAVLQLAGAGKVALDAPLRTYIPEAPAAWSAITVRHLLMQSSGIADYRWATEAFEQLPRNDRTPLELLALVRDKPLEFAPGAKFADSHTNDAALGLIVERAGGKPYADYVAERVLRPAGMRQAGYHDPGRVVPRLAPGYLPEKGELRAMAYIAPSMAYAAANLYATTDDLLAWDRALHDGAALGLTAELKSAMLADQGNGWGYGVKLATIDGEPAVGRDGALPGYQAAYRRFTRVPLTVVLLSNVWPTGIDRMADELARLFFRHCGKDGARCEVRAAP